MGLLDRTVKAVRLRYTLKSGIPNGYTLLPVRGDPAARSISGKPCYTDCPLSLSHPLWFAREETGVAVMLVAPQTRV